MTYELDTPRVADAIVATLVRLLREVAPDDLPQEIGTHGPNTIRRLGLTSFVLLELMLKIEEEFNFEWDDDVELEVVQSFEAMAAYTAEQSPRL